MSALRLASSLCRAVALRPAVMAPALQRGVATTAARPGELRKLPDPFEHAVGEEKWEMIAAMEGLDPEDLWETKRAAPTSGTKDDPQIVPSMYNKRVVGHLCTEDQTAVIYFTIHKGENGGMKRCRCGHWFKIVDWEPWSPSTPMGIEAAKAMAQPQIAHH